VTRFRNALLDGTLAGFAGTAVMTAGLAAEKRLRRNAPGIVDYDASPHVVTAASAALRWQPRGHRQRTALFLAVHWGYGSAVGVGYELIRRITPDERTATALFYGGCQAMAMTLFPTLGGTPPPWRWKPSLLVSSLLQHAGYAITVAATDHALHARSHVGGLAGPNGAGPSGRGAVGGSEQYMA
jgi:hypothetical protein